KRLSLLLPALAGLLSAQEFRGSLTGRITDPAGLGVPGVKIEIVMTDTNSRTETATNAEGIYVAPALGPGGYRGAGEANGFKKYSRSGVTVGTNERITLDIQLEVGSTSEQITVTADVPLLTTATASAGQVITTHEVENLPMNGNTPMALARNALGVVPK